MTTLREAAQQALEALMHVQRQIRGEVAQQDVEDSIDALKAALAQPAPEPVAWVDQRIHGWPDCFVMEADPPHTTPLYAAPPRASRCAGSPTFALCVQQVWRGRNDPRRNH